MAIKTATLGNGLRVVLVQDPHASEVQVTMRYRVGAADDNEHPGISHLVEHLMFQQTLGAQTLMAHLEDNATYFNAVTSHDATTYVSRARPELLDKLLSIEAVRLGFRCTTITDSAFEREREVVQHEMELRARSLDQLDAVYAAIYPDGHPYRRLVGGTSESIAAITREQACAFADAYYAPDNAALVISGNVAPADLEASLGKFLARIPKRTATVPTPVPVVRKQPMREAEAPIDEPLLLVTWPLPADPYARLTLRVLAKATAGAIDRRIGGWIKYVEIGDVRAGVVGYQIEPDEDETVDEVLATVRETLEAVPQMFDPRAKRTFESFRQQAIYRQYASLEDGSERDERLAAHVLAGRDPGEALAAEFRALRELDSRNALRIVRDHFTYDNANIAKLVPGEGKRRGRSLAFEQPTHDVGQRRSVPDVARAHEPDRSIEVPPAAAQTRVLQNGLKVVLLPLSTVPTVDARLVFGAGSAHDPADKRGTALLAAYGLGFDLRHLADIISFTESGGTIAVNVTPDSTSFAARGVDMHLDYLLAGLRRRTVDGVYAGGAELIAVVLRQLRKLANEKTAIAEAWRAARFGAHHPYTHAGVLHAIARTLTTEDAERFRATYFKPDNATLVLAGRFDVALANRWIDYLFADWGGRAQSAQLPIAQPVAASLAKLEDLVQMQIQVALPASRGTRAQRLVAAAMLNSIANDVRHQLGASYVFAGGLDEMRASASYVLGGWIDPTRASDVVRLLRDRLQELREDADAAARAFIVARGRVVAQLASLTGSASKLAARAETDIELGRPVLSDLDTAREVQALTLAQITPLFSDLDLARAAVFMRGPEEPVRAAFALLGREPTILRLEPPRQDDEPASEVSRFWRGYRGIRSIDLDDALTDQSVRPRPRVEVQVSASLATSEMAVRTPQSNAPVDGNPSGMIAVGQVGYRLGRRGSAGLHFSIGSLSGTYDKQKAGVVYDTSPYDVLPVETGVFGHARLLDRLWGGLTLGMHADRVHFPGDASNPEQTSWHRGVGVGFEVGYDIVGLGAHWLAAVARVTGSYGSDTGFGSISLGVAYHR